MKYGKLNDEKLNKLLRKQIYPYEFIDSFEKFKDKKLPEISDFHSSLNFTEITEEEYKSAKYIWREFNCKTLEDFHDVYVLLDTTLLADVFNVFR